MLVLVIMQGAAFIRRKIQLTVDVQEPQSVFSEKLHPGEEHHSSPSGLIEISEMSTQCSQLWRERENRLLSSLLSLYNVL